MSHLFILRSGTWPMDLEGYHRPGTSYAKHIGIADSMEVENHPFHETQLILEIHPYFHWTMNMGEAGYRVEVASSNTLYSGSILIPTVLHLRFSLALFGPTGFLWTIPLVGRIIKMFRYLRLTYISSPTLGKPSPKTAFQGSTSIFGTWNFWW